MTEHATSSTSRHDGIVSIKPFRDDLLYLLHLPDDETTDHLELADVVEMVRQRVLGCERIIRRIPENSPRGYLMDGEDMKLLAEIVGDGTVIEP